MFDNPRRLRIIVLLGTVTFQGAALHVYGASTQSLTSRSCASANAHSSGATGVHSSPRGMSSSVEAGQHGLSSTIRMPDGSTMTITSGQDSSKTNTAQSGPARTNTASRAESHDECRGQDTRPPDRTSGSGNRPTLKKEKQK